MNAVTKRKVSKLKDAGEDFEWYPTTQEIVDTVAGDIKRMKNEYGQSYRKVDLLDIGAGDGRVLLGIKQALVHEEHFLTVAAKCYAIEKANVHLSAMPKEISVIGTDFHDQTLVDKQIEVTFCNPPYSEFEHWAARVIKETASTYVYLVIPRRWSESDLIKGEIAKRDAEVKSLGHFDFKSADRRARAEVEVIRVTMSRQSVAFDNAIEEMLPELEVFESEVDDHVEKPSVAGEMAVGGESVVKTLVRSYDEDLSDLYESYRAIVKINPRLLKELGVTKSSIVDGIKLKISGLKDLYWKKLFDHLKPISNKMATKQRKQFLESLGGKNSVDFTEGNVLSMLIWVSKWASDHFDDQLIELFKTMAQVANVENYKSNKKVLEKGNWRYLRDGESHYKLDFRLVLEGMGGINTTGYDYRGPRGLMDTSHDFLNDLVTVANNLGFACEDRSSKYKWVSNKANDLMADDGTVLASVRAFKNGNLHIKVAKKLMLAINVQAGKLLGWLRSADEAVDELDISKDSEFVRDMFNGSSCIGGLEQLKIA